MKLLSIQAQGFLWTVFLFLLCLLLVHAVKLIIVGLRASKHLPEEPPKVPEKKSEPVYFIVERKKKRAKTEYSEPREVKFQ